MNRRHGKEQSETYKPASRIYGLVVAAAQIEGQRLGCDSAARCVVQDMARMLMHQHSTVACVHGDLRQDAATAGRSEALVVGEIAAVEVGAVTRAHVDGARKLLGTETQLVHGGL